MTIKKDTPKKATRYREIKKAHFPQTGNKPIIGIVGDILWVLVYEPMEELGNVVKIKGVKEFLPVEWVSNRNAFLTEILKGYSLLENGGFSENGKKSLKNWSLNAEPFAAAGVDFSENWSLLGGHTAYLMAEKGASRPSFTIEQKIAVLNDVEYQFSGYFATHRAEGLVTLFCYDENHYLIGEEKINILNQSKYGGGGALDGYEFIKSIFTPVHGTKTLQFKIELGGQVDFTESNGFLFFTELFFGLYDNGTENNCVKTYSAEIYKLSQSVLESNNCYGRVALPVIYGAKQREIVLNYGKSTYLLVQLCSKGFVINNENINVVNNQVQLLFKEIKGTTDESSKYECFIALSRIFEQFKKFSKANDCYLSAIRAMEYDASIKLDYDEKLEIIITPLVLLKSQVLIVGSAPTIETYKDKIASFQGEIWALNDAWFWLEENGISVDKVFITDSRFIKSTYKKIEKTQCSTIIVTEHVNLDLICDLNKKVHIFILLGKNGFSFKYGEVYHGCSVFFTALQTAVSMKYEKISCCGVLLYPPSNYQRINGSSSIPEYTHLTQITNVRNAKRQLDKLMIDLNVFEPESNLNFL